MLVWVALSSGFIIGFHFILNRITSGKSALSTNLHLKRRFQHLTTGLLMILIYRFSTHSAALIMILTPTILFFLLDVIRRKYSPLVNKWFLDNWKSLLRPHEFYDSPPAALFFLCGISCILLLTDSRVITNLSILFISVCDPAASIFGILFGGFKITEKKSLVGTAAAGVAGALITFLVGNALGEDLSPVIGGIIALVAEVVSIRGVDDNLSIPVISCLLWKAALKV